MAESFLCCGEWVHRTNGATESLFECWEQLALAAAAQPGMTTVAAYLRARLDHAGVGVRSFGMDRDYMPDELAGPAESAALLAIIERTAHDPTLVPDVNWSPELVVWWRERLSRMAEALRAGTASHSAL
jgi:hypothetical protein